MDIIKVYVAEVAKEPLNSHRHCKRQLGLQRAHQCDHTNCCANSRIPSWFPHCCFLALPFLLLWSPINWAPWRSARGEAFPRGLQEPPYLSSPCLCCFHPLGQPHLPPHWESLRWNPRENASQGMQSLCAHTGQRTRKDTEQRSYSVLLVPSRACGVTTRGLTSGLRQPASCS